MNELNEEINLTINLMQGDIDDGAHGELQNHLYSLLEMKRNELQQRLVECKIEYVVPDQAPHKMIIELQGQIADEAKPLTTEELKAGGWWCADISQGCANVFKSKGLNVFNPTAWGSDDEWKGCLMDTSKDDGEITRTLSDPESKKKTNSPHR